MWLYDFRVTNIRPPLGLYVGVCIVFLPILESYELVFSIAFIRAIKPIKLLADITTFSRSFSPFFCVFRSK